jgi:hypothetical protein
MTPFSPSYKEKSSAIMICTKKGYPILVFRSTEFTRNN